MLGPQTPPPRDGGPLGDCGEQPGLSSHPGGLGAPWGCLPRTPLASDSAGVWWEGQRTRMPSELPVLLRLRGPRFSAARTNDPWAVPLWWGRVLRGSVSASVLGLYREMSVAPSHTLGSQHDLLTSPRLS